MRKQLVLCAALVLSVNFFSACAQSNLGNILNAVASQAAAASDQSKGSEGSSAASVIGNLISTVTGDLTTTKTTILGKWSYTSPCVQFESENLLAKAGGSAAAARVEDKLATYYKMVGIKAGSLVFDFAEDGKVQYKVGSIARQGTYEFDAKNKTINITTASGQQIKAYVTVTGNTMGLTFEATKLLNLMTTIGSKFQQLQTLTTLASAYDGMKLGFKLQK